jgi:hypothetical protein
MVKRSVNVRNGGALGQSIYDGAASLGIFMAYMSAIIGSIIGVILLIVGIWLLASKQTYSKITSAIIKDADCKRVTEGKSVINDCVLSIEYTIDSKKYEKKINTRDNLYSIGSTIKIRYNPDVPTDTSTSVGRKWIGIILLAIGLLILFGVWIHWYIVTTYKFAAAAQGVGTAYNFVD